MLHTYRKNDAVMVVCQNNDKAVVEIAALNGRAEELVGYKADELVGKPLVDYVSDKLAELITEELDYKDSQRDFGDVLSRTFELHFIHQNGQQLEFRLRLVRSEAIGRNPVFHLVLQEEHVYREHEAFKKILSENFKGHEVIDEATGLPDRRSLLKDLELVQYYTKKRDFMACFAVFEIDNFEGMLAEKGEQYCAEVVALVGRTCRQKMRKEDAVGLMSPRAVGLVLMQITPESSRVVLNRIRWSLSSTPMIMEDGQKLTTTVSVGFGMLSDDDPEKLMIACEKKLVELRGKGGNLLHEVG